MGSQDLLKRRIWSVSQGCQTHPESSLRSHEKHPPVFHHGGCYNIWLGRSRIWTGDGIHDCTHNYPIINPENDTPLYTQLKNCINPIYPSFIVDFPSSKPPFSTMTFVGGFRKLIVAGWCCRTTWVPWKTWTPPCSWSQRMPLLWGRVAPVIIHIG